VSDIVEVELARLCPWKNQLMGLLVPLNGWIIEGGSFTRKS